MEKAAPEIQTFDRKVYALIDSKADGTAHESHVLGARTGVINVVVAKFFFLSFFLSSSSFFLPFFLFYRQFTRR